jgi:hypothetical protein
VVIEKNHSLISAPLLSPLMSVRRTEIALEQHEQESAEPALASVARREGFFLEQISEKTLRKILGIGMIVTSLADKTVKRRPVILAKLRQRKLRPFGAEVSARPRQLANHAPVGRQENSCSGWKWFGNSFHAASRLMLSLPCRQALTRAGKTGDVSPRYLRPRLSLLRLARSRELAVVLRR